MNATAPEVHSANPTTSDGPPRAPRRPLPRAVDTEPGIPLREAVDAAPVFEAEALVHRDELFAAAMRYTKNREAAEDLVQETFLRAFSNWSRFLPGSNCRAWLYRILTNSFINNYRKARRHKRFANDGSDAAAIALYGDDALKQNDPIGEMLADQLSDEVVRALDALGPEYREVVEMADLEGLKYKDIAARLELPIGTVMSRLFRARRKLESDLRDFAATDYGIRRAA